MPRMPDVVMLLIDCLRKDYAAELEASLERRGFIAYDNVYATSPWTVPSIASMLSGLYPSAHGAHETSRLKTYRSVVRAPPHLRGVMLQWRLGAMGYSTFLASAGLTSAYFGFGGFQLEYDVKPTSLHTLLHSIPLYLSDLPRLRAAALETLRLGGSPGGGAAAIRRSAALSTLFKLLNWRCDKGSALLLWAATRLLRWRPGRPKFILIHLIDLHEPYPSMAPRELFTWKYLSDALGVVDANVVEMVRRGYEEELRYVSSRVLEFIEDLDEAGLLDDSLVILTSDHGQLLGEHGAILHGAYLYDELLRVPLIVHYPHTLDVGEARAGGVASTVRVYDLALRAAEGRLHSDAILYSQVAFSESWGLHYDPERFAKSHRLDERVKAIVGKRGARGRLEAHRVLAASTEFKCVYNVDRGVVERVEGGVGEEECLALIEGFLRACARANLRLRLSWLKRGLKHLRASGTATPWGGASTKSSSALGRG